MFAKYIVTCSVDSSGDLAHLAEQRGEQRALAGAHGAHDGHEAAARNLHVDVLERGLRLVAPREVAVLDHQGIRYTRNYTIANFPRDGVLLISLLENRRVWTITHKYDGEVGFDTNHQ